MNNRRNLKCSMNAPDNLREVDVGICFKKGFKSGSIVTRRKMDKKYYELTQQFEKQLYPNLIGSHQRVVQTIAKNMGVRNYSNKTIATLQQELFDKGYKNYLERIDERNLNRARRRELQRQGVRTPETTYVSDDELNFVD